MSGIKVNFEIGHEASLRSKKTPEGFTHDWEVFVRGQEGADISHFVDKIVFHLHETFKKPRRVVKEPPFSVKESGYAGFIFPIEIYLKNKDEPKKITFSYDFTFQQSGVLKDRYIFQNPSEEFRKKLLKGGGIPIPISNNSFYTNPDQETRSRDSFTEEKQQLVSKPKLSTENIKKHKSKEHKEEVPHRTSSFENLFGPPIQKPPKVSPDPKKIEKTTIPVKSEKKVKDRSNSDKKSKHDHKEIKPDKLKGKEEKAKSEKVKTHNKDQEKIKDKSTKRLNERPPSPEVVKKRCLSPIRRALSPPPRSSSASSVKDEYKLLKHNIDNIEQKKPRVEEKPVDIKVEKDVKEKKKKEKKSHDRDKERKDKKEHKKESHKIKESPKEPSKENLKDSLKIRDMPKEREPIKDSPTVKDKSIKPDKPNNKFSLENLRKTPPVEIDERVENHKTKEKTEVDRKHKHKKKDKKRDESREKHKESNKDKKHKHEKIREIPPEKPEIIERRETPGPKERPPPEPASPISIDTASQCSSKSGLTKSLHVGNEDANSSHSDSESSVVADDEDTKVKIENPSPEPINIKHEPSPEPEPEPELEPEPEPEPEREPIVEPPPPQKEKSKKHKDKSAKREEKRRKRKAAEEEMEGIENAENRKAAKTSDTAPSFNDLERGESSGSTSVETKVQDNGVSSSLGEDAEPGELSPDYMVQLRDLQQRIMKIKNNEHLERVVNLIAETGRYEVTTQTFDFDLCLLDRSTVQQLIQLVGC